MKYIIVLGDGMSDLPVNELGNKTPLQVAVKNNIDTLVKKSILGLVKTIPDNIISPGSDIANLSVLGYNIEKYYTGRSPLEALSIGIKISKEDIIFRCNLVTLSDEKDFKEKSMIDYSSDEISTKEAKILIDDLQNLLGTNDISYHSGISYRHCMVWNNGSIKVDFTPPHDILDKRIKTYLPKGDGSNKILSMMKKSYEFLSNHYINKERIKRGLRPANSIWLWGVGTKPLIPSFFDLNGLNGTIISAVDLLKGIGIAAKMNVINVDGATGNIHTNFKGKANAALKSFENGADFVYLHIEAPDECGHRNEVENKVKSIELIDKEIIKTLIDGLDKYEDYKLMFLPDHSTPLSLRTHTSDPVPFMIYQKSKHIKSGYNTYTEETAKESGLFINQGDKILKYFLNI